MQVRPIMVTGDSAHCAAYIGRACGMVAQHADILLADLDTRGNVSWSLMGSNRQDAKLHPSFTTAQVGCLYLVLAPATKYMQPEILYVTLVHVMPSKSLHMLFV